MSHYGVMSPLEFARLTTDRDPDVKVPNFTRFWPLVHEKRMLYKGFCRAVDAFNAGVYIGRPQMEAEWTILICKLYATWKASGAPNANNPKVLRDALALMIDPKGNFGLEAYWAEKARKFGVPYEEANWAVLGVDFMSIENFSASEAPHALNTLGLNFSEIPELDEDFDQEELISSVPDTSAPRDNLKNTAMQQKGNTGAYGGRFIDDDYDEEDEINAEGDTEMN